MISHPYENTSYASKHLYQDSTFPFTMFTINKNHCLPPGPGYHYLHWHEDLQFTIVTKGNVSIQINGETYLLQLGEGIFINSGLLHMTSKISEDGEYISYNFPAKLLSFLYGSLLETEYILPFTSNYSLPAILLAPEIPWQKQLLDLLFDLKDFCDKSNIYAKEYEITIRLSQIWLHFIRHVKDIIHISSKTYISKQQKIQSMLHFIHQNYMNDLSLSDIAHISNISEGECCRIFSSILKISPYNYLTRHRIYKAMDLLRETDLSITDIATSVGFSDCSHFIQLFKRRTHTTPLKYRKQQVH